ncbi:hypothetical protein ACIRSS_23080 [Amycolatopsis sp. NPDC101161]|uniref:hypothetical protein n=1 Tax=Amycolatopsis sp. NPDC101161 TaxID=3363940 RepID=UPI003830E8D9
MEANVVVRGVRRFVLPSGSRPLLDDADFLLVPDLSEWWHADQRPIPVLELATDASSYVLFAAGGAGKTITFQALADIEPAARYLDTAWQTLEVLDDELIAAAQNGTPLYLDSLDEARDGTARVFRWLEQRLGNLDPGRLRLRLACRPIAWRVSLADILQHTLKDFLELKLLPLDRAAAVELTSEDDINGAAFIEAIIDAKLGKLSASPKQLLATAKYWGAEGRLPRNPSLANEFEVTRLLTEADDKRPSNMPQDRAVRIARRLATFASFGEATLFSVAHSSANTVFSLADLPTDPEPAEPTRPVEPDDYRDVLATALFDAAPDGTLIFRHRQYVEYLAAAYLVERGIAPGQVPALLGVHSNGLIPGERAGVAAWLAALQPWLVEGLLASNALTFASASVELPTDAARAAVVTGLLTAAASDGLSTAWGTDLTGLAHPGLAEQLKTRLSGGIRSSEELWWIARLAEAGNCTEVSALLARASLDATWFPYARRAAIHAVDKLGSDADRLSLRELLHRSTSEDPDSDVFSAAVNVLYPSHLSTDELTHALRPSKPRVLGGYYERLLQTVVDRVPDADLRTFSAWFARQIPHEHSHLEDMLIGVVQRTWADSAEPALRNVLAEVVVASLRTGLWESPSLPRNKLTPWSDGPDARRRDLAVAIAEVWPDAAYAVLVTGTLRADDVTWLLDVLPTLASQAAGTLLAVLPQLLREPTVEVADRILRMPPTDPAFAATNHLRGATPISSPAPAQAQESTALGKSQLQEADKAKEDRRAALERAVAQLDADPMSFPEVAYLLAITPSRDPQAIFHPDLTERPGWPLLSAQQQQRVQAAGIYYVQGHQPRTETWCHKQTSTLADAWPDWAGVHLLATLGRHAPAHAAAFESAVWRRWLHPIIATPQGSLNGGSALRTDLLDNVPAELRETLYEAAITHLDHLSVETHHLTAPAIYEHLAVGIVPALADSLAAARYDAELSGDLLALLVQHAPADLALKTCRQLASGEDESKASPARQLLATLDPNGAIDSLASALCSPADLAVRMQGLDITKLDDDHLSSAAVILLDAFPFDTDPPLYTGASFTPNHNAREIRNSVLHRLADTGNVDSLESLKDGRPKLAQHVITRYLRTARTRQADLADTNTSPRAILDLLRTTDARLVRDDADLSDVVIHQLDRLQHQIKGDGAFQELWNSTESPKSEDDMSDWVRRRLHEALNGQLVVDREVQVLRKKNTGVGTRIDLTASAPTLTPAATARVIIEAKLVNNAELFTAMQDQLINRYLLPTATTHGIYLVYWVNAAQRPARWTKTTAPSVQELTNQLHKQADAAPRGTHVRPYVLDISRPS